MHNYTADLIIFPENIEFEIRAISDSINETIFEEEQKLIERSCKKRRQEFKAGRIQAQNILRRLGVKRSPILSGKLRDPLWPEGIVGSISHCDKYCLVAAAKTKDYCSIGIDIENNDPLPGDLERFVCTPIEIEWIRSLKGKDSLLSWSKIIFSAKESAYKCISPILQNFIDFKEAQITFTWPGTAFKVNIASKYENSSTFYHSSYINGAFQIIDGYVFTMATLAGGRRNS